LPGGDGKKGKWLRKNWNHSEQHSDSSLPLPQYDAREGTSSYSPVGRDGQKPVQLDTRFSRGHQGMWSQ